jgi:tyrosyl-tRNA synthetase
MGRKLQKKYDQPEQDILTTPILEGTDGERKMSKSYGNFVALEDAPEDMYGKLMSISDGLIINYFELCTDLEMEEIEEMKKELLLGRNPMEFKQMLAFEIVKIYHSELDAMRAHENFRKIFHEKITPDEMPEIKPAKYDLVSVLVEAKLCSSKTDARRVVTQGGVKVNEKKVEDEKLELKAGDVVQKGPRFFIRIK